MQKRHPVFDGGRQLGLAEGFAHLVFGEQCAIVEHGIEQFVENRLGDERGDLLALRAAT